MVVYGFLAVVFLSFVAAYGFFVVVFLSFVAAYGFFVVVCCFLRLLQFLCQSQQSFSGSFGVFLGKKRGYHSHSRKSQALQLTDILPAHTADGHHRQFHGVGDGPDGLPGNQLSVILGAGRKGRPYTQV